MMPIPTSTEVEIWRTKYEAKKAHEADAKRSDIILLLHIIAILISTTYVTAYIWFYKGKVLIDWLGKNGLMLELILTAIMLIVISWFAFFTLFKSATKFFVDLYQPSDDTDLKSRIQLRFFGVPTIPPPLDNVWDYPFVLIKDGKLDPPDRWVTWLGGPAKLVIFDGCALYLERGNRFSRVVGPGMPLPFLDRTETVKAVVDLRPQVRLGRVSTWTKDGIRIQMEVRMECQIGLEGMTKASSENLIYPYGPISVKKAIERTAVRFDQEKKCLVESDWGDGIWGQVRGFLASYVASHSVDGLFMAGIGNGQILSQNVSDNICQELNAKLSDYGARLLSLQIVNVTIPDDVNAQRIQVWGARKQSVIAITGGQAKAYEILAREKARAEAERDLIEGIADGLAGIDPSKYHEVLVLSLSGILDQSLGDFELRPYIAGETLESLKKLRELLKLP